MPNLKSTNQFINHFRVDIIVILFSLLFSFWLMFSTFSYSDGSMQIATKTWSDFAAHIPLIRSFSFGYNLPPQYPLFSGEPIKYHFLFYLGVGILENLGLPLNFALNLPSSLSFALLLITIYFLAKSLFNSKAVGLISVLFFLFNGSLSFREFFRAHPLSTKTISDIFSNTTFPSFGPWDNKIVSAFWNLNIFTNQRHLALAYALSLVVITAFILPTLKKRAPGLKLCILLGVVVGSFFFLHFVAVIMTVVVLGGLFLLFPILRKSIFITLSFAAIILLPQYLYFQSGKSGPAFVFAPGYLISNNLTVLNFISYWFANLGLHSILMFVGFILAPRNLKKIFLVFVPLFVIGNLFQFSVEMAANHKFFNFFMIAAMMFSAYAVVYLWEKRTVFRPFVIVTIFFLILSGIIDFFPIFNDTKIVINDYPINPKVKWIMDNTSPHSTFLNSSYLYDPASLAGRKIFLGWPYFPWSAGYDTSSRDRMMRQILDATDKATACSLLKQNNLDYIEIGAPITGFPQASFIYHQQFSAIYSDGRNNYLILDVQRSCL